MANVAEAPSTRVAIAEDLLTAWASDVAGHADVDLFDEVGASLPAVPVQVLRVPHPKSGSAGAMPVLHPRMHVALHHAVESLRRPLDEILSASVYGYRRGAEPGSRYAADWRRFSEWVSSTASSDHSYVVHADVRSFFGHVGWQTVRRSAMAFEDVDAHRLDQLTVLLDDAGIHSLPPGYADARMLGNLVLLDADASLSVPFARWVDDYRLLARNEDEARQALEHLRGALGDLGLELNESKTQVVPLDVEIRQSANTLASVYHPDRDPPEIVRESLWRVFDKAIANPVSDRRALRFCLTRLARERDTAAIEPVLRGLSNWPWDAPRAIAYLAAVGDAPGVAPGVDRLVRSAADARDAWLVARLAPLACLLGISTQTTVALSRALSSFAGTPAWGLGLRVLALNGSASEAGHFVREAGWTDPRAALVAAVDLGISMPADLAAVEPELTSVLRNAPAPLPMTDSIL